ncbi:hypothetical protein BDR07DRAFT_834561 [Suillus spraguei]|nr:hypothetical protein BDR07DRAFT_834561 [Suillus spraguei]
MSLCIQPTSRRAESTTAKFHVVLGSEHYFISISANSKIVEILDYLLPRYPEINSVLKRISYKQCKFYKLKNPVLIPDDDSIDIAQQCLDEHNWTEVSPDGYLKVLGSDLRDNRVYLVIKPLRPEEETDRAIENVLQKDEELFRHL